MSAAVELILSPVSSPCSWPLGPGERPVHRQTAFFLPRSVTPVTTKASFTQLKHHCFLLLKLFNLETKQQNRGSLPQLHEFRAPGVRLTQGSRLKPHFLATVAEKGDRAAAVRGASSLLLVLLFHVTSYLDDIRVLGCLAVTQYPLPTLCWVCVARVL